MGIHAHFIKEIKYDKEEIFSLNHDEKFFNLIRKYGNDETNEESLGIMEISFEDWESMKDNENLLEFKEIVKEIDNLFYRRDKEFRMQYVRFLCF